MAKVDKVESKYDGDRSVCLFPIYVDARKTVAEGRKVPMSHAAECPTHQVRATHCIRRDCAFAATLVWGVCRQFAIP